MRNYREMSPSERVAYYRREIRRMTPPRTQREILLVATFQQLIDENKLQYSKGPTSQQEEF